jgi:hypothetical protein
MFTSPLAQPQKSLYNLIMDSNGAENMSNMKHTPGPTLIHRARMDCAVVAEGPFTPLVFERYEYIGGERGWLLGYPIECGAGSGICWSDQAHARTAIAKATGTAS